MKLTDAQAEAINKIAGYNGFDAAAALEFGAVADEQMEALRAENARLREALHSIEQSAHPDAELPHSEYDWAMSLVHAARAALAAKE